MKTTDMAFTTLAHCSQRDSALTRVEDFMMLDVPVQTFIDEDGQVVFSADDVEKALGLEAGEMQEILQHINS